MSELPKLYAVPLHAHLPLRVSEICWGSCGKGIVGAIDLGAYGEAIPCVTPAAECPAFDKEMPKAFGTVNDGVRKDRPVFLRKLKVRP